MAAKIGEILLKLGLISDADVARALEVQAAEGGRRKMGEILTELFVREEDLIRALTMQRAGALNDTSNELLSHLITRRLRHDEIKTKLSCIGKGEDPSAMLEGITAMLEKVATFFDISNRLSDVMSLEGVLDSIVSLVCEVLGAERSTLFLNDRETCELYSRLMKGGQVSEIRFPNHLGIAGTVFTTQATINIPDAYSDARFNREVDDRTGFRTRNILCALVKTPEGQPIGVIQVLNKHEGVFSAEDERLLESITMQASAALMNAQLFQSVQKARVEETRLLEVTTAISSELNLGNLLFMIMNAVTDLLEADRSTLFMHDEKKGELWSLVMQGALQKEIRFPDHLGIAGTVYTTGNTINIPDAYQDPRFNKDVDRKTGYRTRSILCMPVVNKKGRTIGVMQVLNKKGGPFTGVDERRLRAFSAQASIAIENAKLFEEVLNMRNYNESMLESIGNGVITLDATGKVVKRNTKALQILQTDMTGMGAEECFEGPNSWILESIRKVSAGGGSDLTYDTEFSLGAGAGSVSVNLSVVPLRSINEEYLGTMLVFEDITSEKRMKGAMSRYMAKEVAERLLKGGEEMLGGQEQTATVLFTDIRKFTSISEALGPVETVSMLNDYFTIMADIVFKHKGIIDKYIGDAILAVFGSPFPTEADADNAVQTTVDMMHALENVNTRLIKKFGFGLDIGLGVNTDAVISGNIGSLKRMDYTVIGDGVNLASRLEGANKYYGTNILISEYTLGQLKCRYLTRELDRITVQGKSKPVSIFEVLDYEGPKARNNGLGKCLESFAKGYALYGQRRWKEALAAFEAAAASRAKDKPSALYVERCKYFIENPPTPDWDGVWAMKSK